jgi:hypothetical protein
MGTALHLFPSPSHSQSRKFPNTSEALLHVNPFVKKILTKISSHEKNRADEEKQ